MKFLIAIILLSTLSYATSQPNLGGGDVGRTKEASEDQQETIENLWNDLHSQNADTQDYT